MKLFAVSADPIDPVAVENLVRGNTRGGLVTFNGIVRERADDGRAVTGLSYEAHPEMAVAEFEKIAEEARRRFGECAIAIHHRIGDLRIGEPAVVVAVASAHRAVAFDACRYAIDQLKERAPIWKKEAYPDGTAEWRENRCGGDGPA
jgi:molybdopterin synthase catalytic subunit